MNVTNIYSIGTNNSKRITISESQCCYPIDLINRNTNNFLTQQLFDTDITNLIFRSNSEYIQNQTIKEFHTMKILMAAP